MLQILRSTLQRLNASNGMMNDGGQNVNVSTGLHPALLRVLAQTIQTLIRDLFRKNGQMLIMSDGSSVPSMLYELLQVIQSSTFTVNVTAGDSAESRKAREYLYLATLDILLHIQEPQKSSNGKLSANEIIVSTNEVLLTVIDPLTELICQDT